MKTVAVSMILVMALAGLTYNRDHSVPEVRTQMVQVRSHQLPNFVERSALRNLNGENPDQRRREDGGPLSGRQQRF